MDGTSAVCRQSSPSDALRITRALRTINALGHRSPGTTLLIHAVVLPVLLGHAIPRVQLKNIWPTRPTFCVMSLSSAIESSSYATYHWRQASLLMLGNAVLPVRSRSWTMSATFSEPKSSVMRSAVKSAAIISFMLRNSWKTMLRAYSAPASFSSTVS